MRTNGHFFDWGFGLAWTALVALIVGTTWLATPVSVNAATVDPPPWPDTFMEDSWVSTHEELFGPAPDGYHTAFYNLDVEITGPGWYSGTNNIGLPFEMEVLRFIPTPLGEDDQIGTQQIGPSIGPQQPNERLGMVWARMHTPHGSVNVIGHSLTWDDIGLDMPGGAGTGEPQFVTGFMPVIDHGSMMAEFMSDAEPGDENLVFEAYGTDEDDDLPIICLHCLNGGIWCPGNDAAYKQAVAALHRCLALVAAALALATANAFRTLATLTRACLMMGPGTPAMWICLTAAAAAFASQYRHALLAAAFAAAVCYNEFDQTRRALMEAACGD